jgi:hypothetical protein
MCFYSYIFVLTGTIPAFYREVYQTLCTDGSSKIEKDVLEKVLTKSGLPVATVATVSTFYARGF